MAHRGTVDLERTERVGGGGDGGCGKEQEENNNEVDALSKELSGMGCIVDAVRMQPTLCVDASACGDSGGESFRDEGDGASDEDAYLSEEFDVSASDAESEPGSAVAAAEGARAGAAGKSRSSMSMLRATRSSVDTRSVSHYGSLPVPRTNRVNMSFSNSRLRDIERDNRILLNKIMSARGSKRASVAPSAAAAAARRAPPAPAPASLARRQQQRRIDHDNMILLRKIQRVKSSSCSLRH